MSINYKKLVLNTSAEIPYTRTKNSILCSDAIKINKYNMAKYKTAPQSVIYHDNTVAHTDSVDLSYLNGLLNSDEIIEQNTNHKYFQNQFAKNTFDSNFESGNLRMAIEIEENTEYDLIIRPEYHTDKTYQWFFFSLEVPERLNAEEENDENIQVIKLNIINMVKEKSLFSSSVPILMFSRKENKWSRNTFNIFYYSNGIKCPKLKNMNQTYFTLSFCFKHNQNEANKYYFAYGYPYTFTQLRLYLNTLNAPQYENKIKFGTIGKTTKGFDIPMLVITNFNSSPEKKQCILLTSRIHPGETSSSYAIQGVINFLLSTHQEAFNLREQFVFKIIPMLNIDGVIFGNYRYNMKGKDLNRCWITPTEDSSPSVFFMKELAKLTLKNRKIFFYCDFHGHSNKPNYFLYGCEKEHIKNFEYVFMKKLNELSSRFDITNCVNKINQSKTKTGRAVMKNEFGIDLSYCLESSMTTIEIKEKKKVLPFTIEEYKKIGYDFCLALSDISIKDNFEKGLKEINSLMII